MNFILVILNIGLIIALIHTKSNWAWVVGIIYAIMYILYERCFPKQLRGEESLAKNEEYEDSEEEPIKMPTTKQLLIYGGGALLVLLAIGIITELTK